MNKKHIILYSIFLAVALLFATALCVIALGSTYKVVIDGLNEYGSIDDFIVEIKDEDASNKKISIREKEFSNGVLTLTIDSVSKGKVYVTILNKDNNTVALFPIYVHNFGIITYSLYWGDSTGAFAIHIAVLIFLIYLLAIFEKLFKMNFKESRYQYKNIYYLGVMLFMVFAIISQAFGMFTNKGLIGAIDGIIRFFSGFSFFLLPIAFVVSIFVIISNIVLVIKEGLNIRNILGVFLGAFICLLTLAPDFLYSLLYNASWIDVHQEGGIGVYIMTLSDTTIYVFISYLECILMGTIIMGIMSAIHVPSFDKDFIIILGCQVRKDGTPTKILKGRIDKAIEFSKKQKEKTNKDICFVPSGGKGKDEVISEAECMKNYLIEQGIKEDSIILEDKSKNTDENIKLSYALINKKDAKIAFSTTNYHVFRAGAIANSYDIKMEGVGAKTKAYFWINAFIREFIATLYTQKKKLLFALLFIVVSLTFMISIMYISNVIA